MSYRLAVSRDDVDSVDQPQLVRHCRIGQDSRPASKSKCTCTGKFAVVTCMFQCVKHYFLDFVRAHSDPDLQSIFVLIV